MKPINLGRSCLSSLAILLFAFTCQVNVPSMYAELEPKTPQVKYIYMSIYIDIYIMHTSI